MENLDKGYIKLYRSVRDNWVWEEKPLLAPLPATRFELSDWKTATVQFNYHISVDGMLYSVPYEYIKKKVDVKVTDTTIEIFYNHNRIASHRRLKGRSGQYSTITEHMPEDHQKYLEWNGDRFRKWAERIGINTYTAVNAILTSKGVEQKCNSAMINTGYSFRDECSFGCITHDSFFYCVGRVEHSCGSG